jgi:hypothetical protein
VADLWCPEATFHEQTTSAALKALRLKISQVSVLPGLTMAGRGAGRPPFWPSQEGANSPPPALPPTARGVHAPTPTAQFVEQHAQHLGELKGEVLAPAHGPMLRACAISRVIDAELRLGPRVARSTPHERPHTEHIDALLDERSAPTRRGVYQSCVDRGGTAP